MKKFQATLVLAVLCLVSGMTGSAFAQTLTIESVQAGGTPTWWNVSLTESSDGVWTAAPGTYTASNGTTIDLTNLTLTDPSISYGFTVSSRSAASNFSFNFSLPGAIAPGATLVSSTFSGVVTNGTMTPLSGPIQQSFLDSTNAGVDLGASALTGAFSQSLGPIAGPTGGAAGISVTTGFSLSANGSTTIAGTFSVTSANTVPEPSTYAFMALGLGALVLVARLRRVA